MGVFIDSVGISGTDAAPLSYHRAIDGRCYHRLVEDLQHHATYIERSELPERVKSAHRLLVHTVSIGLSVCPLLKGGTQVLAVLAHLKSTHLEADVEADDSVPLHKVIHYFPVL